MPASVQPARARARRRRCTAPDMRAPMRAPICALRAGLRILHWQRHRPQAAVRTPTLIGRGGVAAPAKCAE